MFIFSLIKQNFYFQFIIGFILFLSVNMLN